MNRAYSVLHVKDVQEDQRIIRGMATTPTPDRAGDVVMPEGVTFKNPLPLLWQHRSGEPVGHVELDDPRADGVGFVAQLPIIKEAGKLKDRVDEAWQSIKLGLVRGVSIGFRSLDEEYDKKAGGFIFNKTEVLELSLVTIPANQEASIHTIKSLDLAMRAVTGDDAKRSPPGVTGSINFAPKDAKPVKTLAERKQQLEGRRGSLQDGMTALMQKCTDEDRSKNEDEQKQFDDSRTEIAILDRELGDLKTMTEISIAKAVAVTDATTPEKATELRSGTAKPLPYGMIQVKPVCDAGHIMARIAIAKCRAMYQGRSAYDIAKSEKAWHNTPEVAEILSCDYEAIMKAAVGAGTTIDATFASPLIYAQFLTEAFAALLRPLTIIGRIPGLTRVPFNIKVPRETSSATVGWVGEDAPKPVSRGAFDSITMTWAKAAGIVVLTEELVRFSNPAAEDVVRTQLIRQMVQFLDRQFIDPSVAAVTNVSPASITNGVTPITATGTTMATFRTDARALINSFLINNLQTGGGVWIGTQQQALGFASTLTSLGVQLFPTMSNDGGTLWGYPFIASENIPATGGSPADGYPLIFLVPSEILYADDGQTIIDVSREASVQMDTSPDSPPTGSTAYVSFWQMNYVGIRAERWINWLKRRSTAVGFIQNAKYAE